jgi:DNA-binding transcriptional regulator YiaG
MFFRVLPGTAVCGIIGARNTSQQPRMNMPNIGALLKQEIARLSRREVRVQVQATKKASAQHRRHIAALRRQVAALERQMLLLQRRLLRMPVETANGSPAPKVRFVAKSLRSQRRRAGLSAADYARLLGVSAQSIYNWEHGHATPRPAQLGSIAALRGIGKREAQRRLEQLDTKDPKRRKR